MALKDGRAAAIEAVAGVFGLGEDQVDDSSARDMAADIVDAIIDLIKEGDVKVKTSNISISDSKGSINIKTKVT